MQLHLLCIFFMYNSRRIIKHIVKVLQENKLYMDKSGVSLMGIPCFGVQQE